MKRQFDGIGDLGREQQGSIFNTTFGIRNHVVIGSVRRNRADTNFRLSIVADAVAVKPAWKVGLR